MADEIAFTWSLHVNEARDELVLTVPRRPLGQWQELRMTVEDAWLLGHELKKMADENRAERG